MGCGVLLVLPCVDVANARVCDVWCRVLPCPVAASPVLFRKLNSGSFFGEMTFLDPWRGKHKGVSASLLLV